MRAEVQAQKEPWYSYYKAMTDLIRFDNGYIEQPEFHGSDETGHDAFNSQCFNSKFIADGLKAYTQALMYYITSDEAYRANAMHIIRIWAQMDPAKYNILPMRIFIRAFRSTGW